MVSALLIVAREGVEASLVVAIILAYLRHLKRGAEMKGVWLGVLGAMAFSLGLGFILFHFLGEASGFWGEFIEGLTMWTAVGVLSYMVLWMRRQRSSLGRELRAQVDMALGRGAGLALATLAFVMVFREGAETVLFLGALARTVPLTESILGSVIGLLLALVIGLVVYSGGLRINLRLFFDVTSIVLIAFAAGLVGRATMAFQAIGIFPGTISLWDTGGIIPDSSLLGGLLNALVGYVSRPTVLQAIFFLSYLAVMAYLFPVSKGKVREKEPFTPLAKGYGHPLYRLLRFPWLTRLGSGLMLLVFLLLITVALFQVSIGPFNNQGGLRWGPFGVEGFHNNLFVFMMWIIWLPLVSLSTALLGRFWCGNLCPMGLTTDGARSLAERWLGRGSAVKPYLRLGWLLPTAFILITFYARSLPVQELAWLGAATFLGIFPIALGVGFFLRRGAWCNYFCPIGGWLARIARLSPLALRPQQAICTQCQGKPCLTGVGGAGPCPAYLNPSRLDSNRHCLECWNCVKNCPEDLASLKLGLRAPGAELLKPYAPDRWEALYIAGLVGLYAALIAAPLYFPQIPFALAFFGSVLLAMAAYAGLCALASFLGGMGFNEALTKLGYILLPLEFAMAVITFGDEAWNFFGITVPVVAILLALGFIWSSLLMVSILRHTCPSPQKALRAGLPVMLVLMAILFLWSQWFLAGTVIDVT